MKHSLRTKVTAFVAIVVITVSMVSTFLSISAHRKSLERELLARSIALSEALSRAVDEGLAAENLNLIKQVADIVHTKDVLLVQVFSSLWLGINAIPLDQVNLPPSPAAVAYLANSKTTEQIYFSTVEDSWIDVYTPVYLDSHDPRISRTMLIGYVRLRVSTGSINQAMTETMINNLAAAALLTLVAVIVLNALIEKYLLRPILALHQSISKHKQGEFPESVPVRGNDEIGELSSEFNEMSRALRERGERLAEEKERLAVTLRSIGDAVIVTDTKGTITLLNKIAEQHTGWSARQAIGMQLPQVFTIINEKTRVPCENLVDRVVNTGIIVGLANHTALIRKDGSEIIIEDSAAPIRDRNSVIVGVVLVFRDTTEKRRTEDELIKVEKLKSVGLLAGGLAHDFNNLLTAILGNISMAKLYIDPGNKGYARLIEAEAASRRATDLTYQLLTFSKGGEPVKKTVPIGDLVREAVNFTLSGTPVAAEIIVADDIWSVEVDAGQMTQVFNNLIMNAVQAMPKGGTIRCIVSNVVLADKEVASLAEGAYVKISVHDTGIGIAPESLPRIFDPYFTTKQNGTGLGLTSTYSIIKRHEGHLTVASDPSQGTTFDIYLPTSRSASVADIPSDNAITPGRGKILVMDDEKIIRELAVQMLQTLGYDVDVAGDGKEALEKYQAALTARRPFTVVIMDLTVPGGMGGKDAIQQLLAIDPTAKAIVSSGYSNDPIMADYARHGFKGVITKPYSVESFSNSIREVIQS
jgi:PAS domain S-box-containing protein